MLHGANVLSVGAHWPPSVGSHDREARLAPLVPRSGASVVGDGPVVVFVDTSRDFSSGHVPGAHWTPRGWLEVRIGDVVTAKDASIVVTCTDGLNAVLAGGVLRDLGYQRVAVLDGGMTSWQRTGLPVEQGLSGVVTSPNDVLPMGTDRNWADAMHYLRWEEELGKKYESHHA